jgi:hypothetical protein
MPGRLCFGRQGEDGFGGQNILGNDGKRENFKKAECYKPIDHYFFDKQFTFLY